MRVTKLISLIAGSIAITLGHLFLHFTQIWFKGDNSSSGKDTVISPKCWSMFNIGVQRYQSRIGFGNRELGNGIAPGTSYYKALTGTLPSLLKTLPNGTADLLHTSRVQSTGGKLDYLDCDIRMYDDSEIKRCSALRRRSRDGPLWIAFVGDSKIRDKFRTFLNVTLNFNWYIYNNTRKELTLSSWKTYYEKNGQKFHNSVSVRGDQGSRVDFIWAEKGFEVYNKSAITENELEFWAHKASRVPDVVVVGFGMWSIVSGSSTDSESLNRFSDCADEWLKVGKVLDDLSSRTTVLAWAQSRSREFTTLSYITGTVTLAKGEGRSKEQEENLLKEKLSRVLHYDRLFTSSAEWIDEVMHMALRKTGVIIWDSALPINLLNIKECQILHDLGMTWHPTYFSHNCFDDIHNDVFTNMDENMMIINLLCNEYIVKGNGTYCCPG